MQKTRPKPQLLCASLLLALFCQQAAAMFFPVETERVPISRLETNLEKRVQQNPADREALYALARVHSMAYALKNEEIQVEKKTGKPWYGHTDHGQTPAKVAQAGNSAQAEIARKHLQRAIELYKKALQASPDHLPSLLGLGWCLDQSGDKKAALEQYRKALSRAWEQEKKHEGFMGLSMTEEIAAYMLPLLDPKQDSEEIAKVKSYQTTLAQKPRAVTPLLIPLEDNLSLDDLLAPAAKVAFDLDGSGLNRQWSWITPKAGWLVFDREGSGQITSGLQMFGSVAFWIFWQNGYQALAALDDNADGLLQGEELNGLAIWQDSNGNGKSDPGEVRPLKEWSISTLSCRCQTNGNGILFAPQGVRFKNGTTRPTFDWLARTEDQIASDARRPLSTPVR